MSDQNPIISPAQLVVINPSHRLEHWTKELASCYFDLASLSQAAMTGETLLRLLKSCIHAQVIMVCFVEYAREEKVAREDYPQDDELKPDMNLVEVRSPFGAVDGCRRALMTIDVWLRKVRDGKVTLPMGNHGTNANEKIRTNVAMVLEANILYHWA